jgi:hypothetical protein
MASFGTAGALVDGLVAYFAFFHLKNYNFLRPLLQWFLECGITRQKTDIFAGTPFSLIPAHSSHNPDAQGCPTRKVRQYSPRNRSNASRAKLIVDQKMAEYT